MKYPKWYMDLRKLIWLSVLLALIVSVQDAPGETLSFRAPVRWQQTAPDALCINTASEQALCTLPGIGPKKAAAVIRYRQLCGDFSDPAELQCVPGIGSASYEKLEYRISVQP